MKPYGQYAAAYLEAGFAPIPARGKRTIKNQHHGRGKPWVTAEEVERWASLHANANIAARLPRDVIGIDVDAYGSKPGEETLANLEAELGPLPPTVVSTARRDGVSGIRFFRIPDRYWSLIWPGKAGDGIEIIWHGNRYAIAWPSVHPDTGETYCWFEQDELNGLEPIDGIPDITVMPFLPIDWCDFFARNDAGNQLGDVSDTADWIKEHGSEEMCPQMLANVITAEDGMAVSAHDSARDGTLAIAKDAAAGHKGASQAMSRLYAAFSGELGGRSTARRAGMRSEWKRHFDGAVRIAVGTLKGASVPSADPCEELSDLAGGFTPTRTSKAVLWAGDVVRAKVSWLQRPLLPFGALSILDGDPGQGKSTICDGMVARAVQGLPLLPFGEHCGRPVRAGIIGAEDDLGWIVGRLEAAGYDAAEHGQMVAFYRLARKRGKLEQITFPEGVEKIRSWIMTAGLEFVIVDPVTSFLGENVKSHVDASVRGALGPLASVAQDTGTAILMVRHLNKSGDMKAMYRGGGSIAFSAIARSGLITGQLPDSEDGKFGLAQVKCSAAPKMDVSLAYSVTGWEEDQDIPVIKWHGEAGLSADELVAGPKSKHGPDAEAQQDIAEILEDMFARRDTWLASECEMALKKAGYKPDTSSVKKVKKDLGIKSLWPPAKRGQVEGIRPWYWTIAPEKVRGWRAGGNSSG